MPFAIAIHGGAGLVRRDSLTEERRAACEAALHRIITQGAEALAQGTTALDVAVDTVAALEDDPRFNAGHGAVLAADGSVELEASVMNGLDARFGAVSLVRTVRNPVRLARAVLERSPHVYVAGPNAEAFADREGLARCDNADFILPERVEQLTRARAKGRFQLDHGGGEQDVYGTVGAVVCDAHGHLAAATSTGGMTNKWPGRIGDSPLVGAGTWADGRCAASATGHGEPLAVLGAARRVATRMELLGEDLRTASQATIHDDLEGEGGLIAVDRYGNIAMPFNTAGMFRAAQREGETAQVAIWKAR
ncbi:MAG: isoaspartyl peptidase/L-asparaginase [Myxococcota bacterium]